MGTSDDSADLGHRPACALRAGIPRFRYLSRRLRVLARAPAGSYVALENDPIFARAAVNTLIFLVIGINVKMVVALFLSGFFIRSAGG